jgi:hypothetical protein
MAQLQATTTPSMTVDTNVVWTAANSSPRTGTPGMDANAIAGYDIRFMEVKQNTVSFNQLSSGALNTFYPVVFNGASWRADGGTRTMYMNITRATNQDGTNFGSLNAKIRYRATNWGYHRSYWELTENWGSGTYYPFIATADNSPQNTLTAIWLRGGVTYNFQFGDGPESIVDGSTTSPKGGTNNGFNWNWLQSNPSTTLSSRTTIAVPSNAHFYQQHLCSKGFDLGASSFRWQNCFVNAKDISSDQRFKEDFKPSYSWKLVEKLKPCSYKLIDDEKEIVHMGFLAQDVKQAMDELGISEEEFAAYDGRNPDHLSLSYDQFIPALINSIKEADEEINNLLNMLDDLEKDI